MLAFGLNKKLCSDFLKKQAVIGNLDEGERAGDLMGEVGARASPLYWGFPPRQEEGICYRNLSPGLAFPPPPKSMDRMLWLCDRKSFLLRDGGCCVAQPGQR